MPKDALNAPVAGSTLAEATAAPAPPAPCATPRPEAPPNESIVDAAGDGAGGFPSARADRAGSMVASMQASVKTETAGVRRNLESIGSPFSLLKVKQFEGARSMGAG